MMKSLCVAGLAGRKDGKEYGKKEINSVDNDREGGRERKRERGREREQQGMRERERVGGRQKLL